MKKHSIKNVVFSAILFVIICGFMVQSCSFDENPTSSLQNQNSNLDKGKKPNNASILTENPYELHPQFTDIDADPVIPGGLSSSLVSNMLANGWVQYTTSDSRDSVFIKFRNSSTNEIEWRWGTVPSGRVYLKNTNTGAVKYQDCGNDEAQDILETYGG